MVNAGSIDAHIHLTQRHWSNVLVNVYCIFDRLGVGGGGKVKAVYNRLNAIAENSAHTPILLTTSHDMQQKVIFEKLVEQEKISRAVQYLSIFDAAAKQHHTSYPEVSIPHPSYDYKIEERRHVTYYKGGIISAQDRLDEKRGGEAYIRTMFEDGRLTRKYQISEAKATAITVIDGSADKHIVNCSDGRPISTAHYVNNKFIHGVNFITRKSYDVEGKFFSSFIQLAVSKSSITFIDGISIPFNADMIKTPKILFLHADHRAPNGNLVTRARNAVENFNGNAIITATNAHKAALEADFVPRRPIEVLPHYCDQSRAITTRRRDIVTVSRLDPVGKPIAECIEAFSRIEREFPDSNYLIYGEGSGKGDLLRAIKENGMEKRVKLMGYTTSPMSIFSNAIASLYPTLTEGFGLAILESLSQDCPVLSYDVDYGPKDMIKNGRNGELVTPGNIDQIVVALRRILNNPEKYSSGCGVGLEKYSRERYIQNYQDLIDRLVNQS